MEKITQGHLDRQLALINKLMPDTVYEFEYAYGGIKLVRKDGKEDVSQSGFATKRELYNLMVAYRMGIQHAQERIENV